MIIWNYFSRKFFLSLSIFLVVFLYSKEFYKGREYEKLGEFRNGYAPASKKNFWGQERWGFIDTRGNVVISFIYEDAWYFNEYGLRIVSKGKYSKDKKKLYGFVRKTDGFYFDQVRGFKENVAAVRKDFGKNKKWGFINRKLKIIVPFDYDHIDEFKNDFAKGKKRGRTVYFDKEADVYDFFAKCKKKEFKNYVIIKRNDLYGVITPNQQIVKDVKFVLDQINGIYY